MKKTKMIILAVLGSLLTGCSNPVADGTNLLKEGKYTEAAEAFDEAIEKWQGEEKKAEQTAEAFRGKGIAYWELGEYERAKEEFLKALDKGTKKTGTIYNFIGICEMKKGNFNEAVSYFQQGLACADNSVELNQEMELNQISAYEELRDWDNAKTKMAEYIAKYPDDEEAAKEAQFLETR